MKIVWWFVFLGVFMACSRKESNEAIVRVEVEDMTDSVVLFRIDGQVGELYLNTGGKGEIRLPVSGFAYAEMYYGDLGRTLFLEDGEELTVSFKADEFDKAVRFEGKNASVEEFLNTAEIKQVEEKDFALPFKDFYSQLKKLQTVYTDSMASRQLEAVNSRFVAIEKERIAYMYNLYVVVYPMYRILLYKDSLYQPDDYYYNTLAGLVKEEEELTGLKDYRDFIQGAAFLLSTRGEAEKPEYENILSEIRYVGKNFTNDKVKQALIHAFATDYVEGAGISGLTDLENLYYTYVTDPKLRAEYKEVCRGWDLAAVGKVSPDFEAVDPEGKTYTLENFKGKYLFIDVWATWCDPCKQELPYLKALEEKFRDKNIYFLGLSIDRDKAAWEKMVKSGQLTGTQLFLGEDKQGFRKAYHIDGVPRFILLDPQGRIVENEMMRPSAEGIERFLSNLSGI